MVEIPIGRDTQIREQESEEIETHTERERQRHHIAEMVCDFSPAVLVFAIFLRRSIDMDGSVVVIRIYFGFRFRNRATIYPT